MSTQTWMLALAMALALSLAGCGDDSAPDEDNAPQAPVMLPNAVEASADEPAPELAPAEPQPLPFPTAPAPADEAQAPAAPAAETPAEPVDARAIDRSRPQAAVAAMAAAIDSGQADQFYAVAEVAPEQKPFYDALFDWFSAQREFDRAGRAAFGEQAWQAEFSGMGPSGLDSQAVETITATAAQMQLEQDGDQATLSNPDGGQVFHLVRRQGQWRVRPDAFLGTGTEQDIAPLKAMTQAFRQTAGKADDAGMTLPRFQQEFQMALQQAMMKALTAPEPPAAE